jgi:hypothetical protein
MCGSDPSRYLAWLREETALAYAPISIQGGAELEEALAHPRLLIEGDAGSGKTSFLRHVAGLWVAGLLDARTSTLLFPIFIRMSELADHIECRSGRLPRESPEWLIDFLDARSRELSWGLDADFFRERLGGGFLLLDGLDESPRWMASLVENAADFYRECRIVLATRTGQNGVAGFHRVRIGPG